jgi:NADH dehydrogenase (ubiquinone) 1 beta subcomplex subunit 9
MPGGSPTSFATVHRQYVQSLYKRRLKNSLDWTISRHEWRYKAMQIRAEFEHNRSAHHLSTTSDTTLTVPFSNVKDPRQLARVLEQAEAKLAAWKHPDPYIRQFCTSFTRILY